MAQEGSSKRRAEDTGPHGSGAERRQIELRVGGLDCEHDAAALRRGMEGHAGIDALEVRAASLRVTVRSTPR